MGRRWPLESAPRIGAGRVTTTPQTLPEAAEMVNGIGALREAQRRVNRAAKKLDDARAERDDMIVRFARTSTPYRKIAEATGLSLASIGKIAAAGGVRKYGKETTTP